MLRVAIGAPATTRAHVERVWALLREDHDWLAADFAEGPPSGRAQAEARAAAAGPSGSEATAAEAADGRRAGDRSHRTASAAGGARGAGRVRRGPASDQATDEPGAGDHERA